MYCSHLPLSIALSLVSCLSLAKAQSGGSNSSGGFLQQYLTFLNSTGYTSLSSALQQVQQSGSASWLDQLSSGNWTVFAPNNQAFSSLPSNVSNSTQVLSDYLSYHFVYGNAEGPSSNSSSSGSSSSAGSASQTSTSSSGTSSATGTSQSYRLSKLFLNYHHLNSNGTTSGLNSSTAVYPNVTIGRTLLTDETFVQLEGNRSQVLAWSNENGNVTILNQAVNTTVGNTTLWQNILHADINSVLIPPGNLSTALTAVNDTLLLGVLNTVQVPVNGTNTSALNALEYQQGFTFFAPNTEAFTSEINNTLQILQNNQTAFLTLLQNHYINGSTIYSPELTAAASSSSNSSSSSNWTSSSTSSTSTSSSASASPSTGGGGGSGSGSSNSTGPLISAAGEPFTFTSNQTGLYVSNGNGSSARIVRPDVLLENGVVHIIDQFLVNEASNPSAATSAVAAASSFATETASDTAILGIPTSSTSQSGSSQSSSSGTSTGSSATGSVTASAFRFRRGLFV